MNAIEQRAAFLERSLSPVEALEQAIAAIGEHAALNAEHTSRGAGQQPG